MKHISIGDVRIPFDDYVTQGTAVLGIRGAGKTYTAKGIAEQLLDAKIPIVVFDAIGVWRYLKVAADDSHGRAYKVVVAGGQQPDLPLTQQSAQQIIRAAIKENIPLVIDLYDTKLSKADWRRIVQDCFRILLYENKGLRHIFLEEAAEYAPQKVMDGQTFAEVEKLVRMGGNASLGITLINQRSQEVNKSVLELCDNLVMMKQKGFNAIAYAEKWAERLSKDQATEIANSMPKMGQGDCWIWTDSLDAPVRTKSGAIHTFHPDRKRPENPKNSVVADPTEFVEKLSAELVTVIAEAKANDPAELKREITRLKAELSKKQSETQAVEIPIFDAADRQLLEKVQSVCEDVLDETRQRSEELSKINVWLVAARERADALVTKMKQPLVTIPGTAGHFARWAKEQPRKPSPDSSNGNLGKGERTVLTAIAQHGEEGCTREQITVLTGYKRSSRDTYIQRIASAGYVVIGPVTIMPTAEGIFALGPDFEPLPTGDALRSYWLQRLSGGERTLLEILIHHYPDDVDRDAITDQAGYQRSSRDTYIQRLSSRKLVEITGPGQVKASDKLFS
jgi:uncharacterized small protein (DUF1192 family)